MTWQPQYAAADDVAAWLGDDTDVAQLALVVEAASRAIDQATGRQFGMTESQAREYVPRFRQGLWDVTVDDLPAAPTAVEIVHQDGTVIREVTNYVLTPRNAVPNGKPYTGIEFRGIGDYWPIWGTYPYEWAPHHHHHLVRVTAQFGWPAIPDPIALATRLQAARFYARKDQAVPLVTEQVDDIRYQWNGATLDPDIEASVAPFRRWWAAL